MDGMKGSFSGSNSKNPSARTTSTLAIVGVVEGVGFSAMLANGYVRRLAGVMVTFAPMGGIAGVCKVAFMTVFAALGNVVATFTVSGATGQPSQPWVT